MVLGVAIPIVAELIVPSRPCPLQIGHVQDGDSFQNS